MSAYLHPADLSSLKHIGFRAEGVASFGNKAADWKCDPVIDLVYKELGIYKHFNVTAYGRIRETHYGGLNGILKYDGPDMRPDVPRVVLKDAKRIMFAMFSPHFDTCPIVADDEVEIPLDTHPGVEFRDMDYKDKGAVFRDPQGLKEVLEFWQRPSFPTVWKEAVKGGELLKESKLDKNDARVFLIPGLKFHWLTVKMLQTQHKLFLDLAQDLSWPIKIGFSFQNGGFCQIFDVLGRFPLVGEGDCTKYDSSIISWLWFHIILPLRIYLFKPTAEMSREEFARRLLGVYKDVCYTIIVLPNGQVVVKLKGMPSGFYLTGDDNSLAHIFVIICMYVFYNKEEQLKKDKWFIAADDHIFGTADEEIASYDVRKDFYARFGISLTKDKDLVTQTCEGHTFLGFTAHRHGVYEKWVPVFNLDKALCSALRPGGKVTDTLRYVRLCSLRMLCFFHPKYDLIKEIARRVYMQGFDRSQGPEFADVDPHVFDILTSFPTDSKIEALWLGNERAGLEGPKNFVQFLLERWFPTSLIH